MTLIKSSMLRQLINAQNPPPPPPPPHPTIANRVVRTDPTATVALVIGGAEKVMTEYEAAFKLISDCPHFRMPVTFVCNDMIAGFPHRIDHAVTLHPDKMLGWIMNRHSNSLPPVVRTWAHRSFTGITNWTRDWQGSSGLFMVKIARELGFTHIILCGVPMDRDAGHVRRLQPWNAADGFQRGWIARIPKLRPFVRSMSGWTQRQLGFPSVQWLAEIIPDTPMDGEPIGVKA